LSPVTSGQVPAPEVTGDKTIRTQTTTTTGGNPAVVQSIREHLRKYRDLAGQGRWAEAGKELEAIESAVK